MLGTQKRNRICYGNRAIGVRVIGVRVFEVLLKFGNKKMYLDTPSNEPGADSTKIYIMYTNWDVASGICGQ